MSVISTPVRFVPMARRAKEPAPTDQINFRLKRSTIDRMERYKERHPLRPSLTQIVEAAVADWLNSHEGELPKKPK